MKTKLFREKEIILFLVFSLFLLNGYISFGEEKIIIKSSQEISHNYLYNGSFEVGISSYEWSTPYQSCYTLSPEFWSNDAFDGEKSLCVRFHRQRRGKYIPPAEFRLLHRVIELNPRTDYHFSGVFKSDQKVNLRILIETAYGKPQQIKRFISSVKENWEKIDFEFKTTDEKKYFLKIEANSDKEANLWIDSLVLSEESPDRFIPFSFVETGIFWDCPGKVFYIKEPVTFKVFSRNYLNDKYAEVNLNYRVIDYFGNEVIKGKIRNWKIPPETTAVKSLNLNTGKTGSFALFIEGEATAGKKKERISEKEYAFSILYRPPLKMEKTFGAYITLAEQPLKVMSRAGIRRTVTLSCNNELLNCWASIQPDVNEYIWWDEAIELAKKYDIDILVNFDIPSYHGSYGIPKWALNPKDEKYVIKASGKRVKPFTISKKYWEDFIENFIKHYHNYIKDYLIIDEPYHVFKPEEYVELLKSTYKVAKRIDGKCRIWAHGGYYDYWLVELEKKGAFSYFDGIYDYSRKPSQGAKLKKFGEKYKKPVMNVEYSWMVSRYSTIEVPKSWRRKVPEKKEEREKYKEYIRLVWTENTENLTTIPLRAMGWAGGIGFNRYDARYPGGDFYQLDNYKCMFEYDGTLKPSAVAYAITSYLLDGFKGVCELKIHPQLECFLLENKEKFAIVFWTKDKQPYKVRISLPYDDIKFYNIMGNPLNKKGEVCISGGVNYIIGHKKFLDSVKEIIKNLKLSPLVELEILDKNEMDKFKVVVKNNSGKELKGFLFLAFKTSQDVLKRMMNIKVLPGENYFLFKPQFQMNKEDLKSATMYFIFNGGYCKREVSQK